ncbi:MAG: indolepyruvate oxidoreductase subunit beta family protein [Piscinibacter sp.]
MNASQRPVTILVCALGGEGGGVLSEWLFAAATLAGHSAQSTSIPGVAQRTGATTYYIEVFAQPDAMLGGRKPVFCLNPVPGAIDLLVSSELLETVRQVGLGMASAERTTIVSSSARALTVAEKMQLGDGRLDDRILLATLQQQARQLEVLDLARLARDAGTVVSAVLLGAIAASGVLPMPREAYEQAIRAGGKGVEASLRGFALAFAAVQARRVAEAAAAPRVAAPALPPALAAAFPAPVHGFLALGHARLVDYQDEAYAALYVERLAAVLAAERGSDRDGSFAATREAARWLALWMAFDDIVQVAALKLRRSRVERVCREVAAREDEIVKVFDHFKPGVPEFAALLPASLAQRLSAWDARRQARGLAPWALPLKLGTHGVRGVLALRLVASMKGQRRRGSRFALEQALIERWLAALQRGLREDAVLGREIADCGRLIKGYGSTNERGKHNLLHVIEHLALGAKPAAERAAAIRAAREAALADEGGLALDRTLAAHGAPPRPLKAQPVRFYRRRPEATAPR